jgi:heme exporter protein C
MIGRLLANGLGIIALLAVLAGLYLAFFYAPPDALQGDVQRIMYVHVPTAWVAFFAFFVVFLASILFVIYVGYLRLRSFIDEPERRARLSALVGIVGFIDVPIIYMSVLWFRTLHQPPSIQRGGASMPDAMLFTLLFNFGAYTLVYLFFLVKRVRIESLQAILDTLSVEKAIRD